MDMESGKQRFITAIKKYQYALLVVLAGVFLMLLPQKKEEPQQSISLAQEVPQDLETELSAILSQISGVGRTEILLTEASGSDTIYQTNTNQNKLDTVIVMDGSREEAGLIKQILPPVYKGAIVVCQGAEQASVRLAVINAVKSATGLSADCITVLKMK